MVGPAAGPIRGPDGLLPRHPGGAARALRQGGLLHAPLHLPVLLESRSVTSALGARRPWGSRLGFYHPPPACGPAALGGSRVDIIERIDRLGRMTPDRAAHHSGGRTLTYGELRRRSDALAARLAGSLPGKSPVVVLGHKEPELLVAYLGAIKSGRAYVPVDTAVPPQRVERIVAASGAALTLTPEKVAGPPDGPEPAPACRMETDDHYYIMFTSGSTGEPKGVPITYGCLQSFLRWTLGEHPFEEGRDVFLNVVPYSF